MSEQNDTEQFREFITKLQRNDMRPLALKNIKTFIAFKSNTEASSTIRNVGLSEIIKCLNLQDKSNVNLTCEVLKVCFEKFDAGDIVKSYTGNFMYLLRHEKSCVRRIAIDEVYRAVVANALMPISDYIDVLVAAAQMVSDSDGGVANKAMAITSNLPLEAYPRILDELKFGLECNSSAKCNVLEVAVNVSCKSTQHFNLCVEKDYIDFMITELQNDDVLYQVNILELLSRLVQQPYGINYLIKNGGLNTISAYVVSLNNHPLRGLLMPGYMKFFGSIAHKHPKEMFEKHYVMLDAMFEAFDTLDQTMLPVALDTLGFIASTIEGKLCLAALGHKYTQTVGNVAELIRNSSAEIKVRALHCFAGIIGVQNDPAAPKTGPIDHRVTLMTREWFRTLDSTSMESLLEICKNPFPDIRQASFVLLESVCQHQWGVELVARTAGFIEFLLDRSVVYTKETNEIKYDIIKRLAKSPAFDAPIIARLQTYVEQGPFYSESVLEVAMDEGEN